MRKILFTTKLHRWVGLISIAIGLVSYFHFDIAAKLASADTLSERPTITPMSRATLPVASSPIIGTNRGVSYIRGLTYLDENASGLRETGEPILPLAIIKIASQGSWYVCANSGSDGTFAIPVSADSYWVIPVASPGLQPTSGRIFVRAEPELVNTIQIGFTSLDTVTAEYCGQYAP